MGTVRRLYAAFPEGSSRVLEAHIQAGEIAALAAGGKMLDAGTSMW